MTFFNFNFLAFTFNAVIKHTINVPVYCCPFLYFYTRCCQQILLENMKFIVGLLFEFKKCVRINQQHLANQARLCKTGVLQYFLA